MSFGGKRRGRGEGRAGGEVAPKLRPGSGDGGAAVLGAPRVAARTGSGGPVPLPAGPRGPGALLGCPVGDPRALAARPGGHRSPFPSGTFPASALAQESHGGGPGPFFSSRRSCPCRPRGRVLQTHAMRWQQAAAPKFLRCLVK